MGFFLPIHTRRDVLIYAELESYFKANIKKNIRISIKSQTSRVCDPCQKLEKYGRPPKHHDASKKRVYRRMFLFCNFYFPALDF